MHIGRTHIPIKKQKKISFVLVEMHINNKRSLALRTGSHLLDVTRIGMLIRAAGIID
jgi:hypothetical protein